MARDRLEVEDICCNNCPYAKIQESISVAYCDADKMKRQLKKGLDRKEREDWCPFKKDSKYNEAG